MLYELNRIKKTQNDEGQKRLLKVIIEWLGLEGTLKMIHFRPPAMGRDTSPLDQVDQSRISAKSPLLMRSFLSGHGCFLLWGLSCISVQPPVKTEPFQDPIHPISTLLAQTDQRLTEGNAVSSAWLQGGAPPAAEDCTVPLQSQVG